jgi:hypothetical protein
MDNVSKLIERIGMIHVQSVPVEDWEEINWTMNILVTYAQATSSYRRQGVETSYVARISRDKGSQEYAADLGPQLRQVMYEVSPEKGAWFAMKMTIKASGDFDVNFDYESRPQFSIEMDDEDFIKDYKAFPRGKEMLPGWLHEILLRNKVI